MTSESSFEEFINYIFDSRVYNYPSRRYLRDADNPLEVYDDDEFRKRYRLTKDSVVHILLPLLTNNINENDRGLPLTPILQVLIALRFYANFQIVCGDLHKISQSVVSKTVANISKRLALKSRQFIKFPALNERVETKRKFYRIAGFPGVIGCIDCTHIPIKNPSRARGEIFRNRKGWFSINVQIICGPQMEIYDIVVRWPGSVHDSRIFNNSRLRFEEGDLDGILVGDSGYAQTGFMYTPVLNPQTDPEHRYNRACVNGVLKRRFACLCRKLQYSTPNTCNIIVSCAALHNICLMTNEPELNPEIELENVPVPNTQDSSRGSIIRSAFISRHFS
ncbi:putative nuclease HARBI1 [Bombyx mori]|uniref:Putative nuclease HARBI1 n=1 Tax=Bombyx mori TaxID=7091 RepID=A0A8R2QV86_BOMMO|nr:putative nuclease HARBI1 [Bombyx mori]